jgi:cell division protein FtsB
MAKKRALMGSKGGSFISRLWLGLFAIWGLMLTGVLASFVGSPGVIQLVRLKNLLDAKQTRLTQIQSEIDQLESERASLEKSHVAQQREIRKVLGYAAQDEIIFEFSAPERGLSGEEE